jgi:serine/threonine-protein kinase
MTIPERLGKYPITAVLGKGAMGIVYRAYDPVIKRPVAIKTIRKELIEDDDKAEHLAGRFRTEAQAAGSLNHPGIVSVYEYGEDQQFAYIAMEYVEGNSLREYLTRGTRFDEHDIVSIMAQLLDALEYAHSRSVWHRDIKPANIIVMSNGRIKLTDFGIARIETADRTRTNVIMGTPGYIAPELYLGGQADHRIDIFASGVLFYHLLATQPPFRGRPEAVMHDVCYHDPEPPSRVDPQHRWPQYDPLVSRALQKSPSNRFPSASAFRSAILAEYAQPLNSSISESTIITSIRPVTMDVTSTPQPPRTTHAPLTSTPPPSGWSAPVLAGVEVELARFVGPVAKVMVRRAAKVHKTIEPLVDALLPLLEHPKEREAFQVAVLGRKAVAQRAAGQRVPAAAIGDTGALTPVPEGPPVSSADVEQITKLLTTYIGPIARVIVKRAAAAGPNRRAFLEQLARSLDSDAQRERFLREASAVRG